MRMQAHIVCALGLSDLSSPFLFSLAQPGLSSPQVFKETLRIQAAQRCAQAKVTLENLVDAYHRRRLPQMPRADIAF